MPLANKQEFPLWLTQIAHDRVFPEAAQIGCRPDGVLVRTKTQEVLAQRVILALGPWLSRAVPEIASMREVTRQAVGWFMPARPETVLPGRIPLFILERVPDDVIYGFPDFEQGGVKVRADDRDPPPMDAELLPVCGKLGLHPVNNCRHGRLLVAVGVTSRVVVPTISGRSESDPSHDAP